MNHYPNHPRFITVAEFDVRGQYQNINVALLNTEKTTETEPVYDIQAHQTPVLVPHLAPVGKDWLWSSDTQNWMLIDNYDVIPVYSKIRVEQCVPPEFGEQLTEDMTLKVPPIEAGKITYWDAKTDGWAMRDDLTGTQVFNTADPRQSLVLGRDDWAVPKGYTEKPRPSEAHDWDAKKQDWMLNAAKQAELDAQIAQAAGMRKLAEIEQAIHHHLEQVVAELGLGVESGDKLISLYAGYDNPLRPYAEAFGKHRAQVWVMAKQDKDLILAGKKPIPTVEDAVAAIPPFAMTEIKS